MADPNSSNSAEQLNSPPVSLLELAEDAPEKSPCRIARILRRPDPIYTPAAHLLVPGSTFTGMTARGRTEKPPGSWMPEQVVDFMVGAMSAGDFYIICPDNDVTRDIDNRRILWAAEDIICNRPALSRWHPDHRDEFAEFLTLDTPFRR
jgi:hypothetical protein